MIRRRPYPLLAWLLITLVGSAACSSTLTLRRSDIRTARAKGEAQVIGRDETGRTVAVPIDALDRARPVDGELVVLKADHPTPWLASGIALTLMGVSGVGAAAMAFAMEADTPEDSMGSGFAGAAGIVGLLVALPMLGSGIYMIYRGATAPAISPIVLPTREGLAPGLGLHTRF